MKRDDLKTLQILTRQFGHYCNCLRSVEALLNGIGEYTPDLLDISITIRTTTGHEYRGDLTPAPEDGAKVMPLSADNLNELKIFLESRKAHLEKVIAAFKVKGF